MNYFLPFITCFSLGILFSILAEKFFPQLGLMDKPHNYGLKRDPIPYFGGLIIIFSFLIGVILFVKIDIKVIGMLIGAILVAITSFLDDKFGLSPKFRLFIQLIAGIVLFVSGINIENLQIPFLGNLEVKAVDFGLGLPILSLGFTLVWVVTIMNSLNFLDGISGLTSGVSSIGTLILFLLSIRPDFHAIDQGNLAILCLILLGGTLALWLKDFYPAKILMGDTGSMFLGFMLATLSLFAGGKLATAFLILGFPIVDAFLVILRRILNGKSPFSGDYSHLHHRLLRAGYGHRQTILILYFLSFLFGILGVYLENLSKFFVISMVLLTMIALEFFIQRKSLKPETEHEEKKIK